MASDLAEYTARVSGLLQDSANLRFSTEIIANALRQTLAEYSLAKGTVQTICSLDSAAETTVPDGETPILILGAVAYVYLGRVGKRLEGFNEEKTLDREMVAWGEARLGDFHRCLEQIRQGAFRGAAVVAWPALGWTLDEWDANHG